MSNRRVPALAMASEATSARAEACMAGVSFCAHRQQIENKYGRPLLLRAVERLEPEQQEQVMGVLSVGWVPISTQQALYEALALETGDCAEELHMEMVRRSVEHNMRTLWRLLLRLTSDEALILRGPLLFKKGYRQGTMVAEKIAAGRGRLTVSEWPNMPAISLRGLRVGIETILKLAGRRDVRVKIEPTADGARLEVSFDTTAHLPHLTRSE